MSTLQSQQLLKHILKIFTVKKKLCDLNGYDFVTLIIKKISQYARQNDGGTNLCHLIKKLNTICLESYGLNIIHINDCRPNYYKAIQEFISLLIILYQNEKNLECNLLNETFAKSYNVNNFIKAHSCTIILTPYIALIIIEMLKSYYKSIDIILDQILTTVNARNTLDIKPQDGAMTTISSIHDSCAMNEQLLKNIVKDLLLFTQDPSDNEIRSLIQRGVYNKTDPCTLQTFPEEKKIEELKLQFLKDSSKRIGEKPFFTIFIDNCHNLQNVWKFVF
ncbi:hypothetical protein PV326_001621 [Microctonus aethiopoides]|nr:hypothetical protein PV326_001621 [Microctonus aethiopoides]